MLAQNHRPQVLQYKKYRRADIPQVQYWLRFRSAHQRAQPNSGQLCWARRVLGIFARNETQSSEHEKQIIPPVETDLAERRLMTGPARIYIPLLVEIDSIII